MLGGAWDLVRRYAEDGLDTAVHGPNSDLLVSISAIGQVSEGLLSIGMRFHTRSSPAHA